MSTKYLIVKRGLPSTMKKEVISAVNFLVHLLRINSTVLSEEQLVKFRQHAYECLWQHYQDHWFPEKPMKGSGYRCIRINGKMDPLIARAGELVGLASGALRSLFPSELTMWVDPMEVAYRIGENGSICNLYANTKTPSSIPASATTEVSCQEEVSPTKPASPKHQPPAPSPHHPTNQQAKQFQHHFSPSKTSSTPVHYQSPPRSPVSNSTPSHQQLAMFLMNNHSNSIANCKDSLRSSALESSTVGMERLFVSS